MSVASASERLVDSVGPIVVKEVRQGLRARVFALFFGTLLVVCLAVALMAVAQATRSVGAALGKEAYGAYLTALGVVCFFVLPFVAFRSMLRELEDETWVLLTLTGLGARSIVRGKWISAMSQALLFGSACAPFVLFSYFLNGIDLLQIVTGLVLAAGWSAGLSALALAVATQAHGKLGRTLAHFVVLGVLGFSTAAGIGFAWVLAEEGARLVSNAAFRNFVIATGLFSWALTALLLESAATGLALPSEPASRGPRVAYLLVSLLALGFGLVVFLVHRGRGTDAMGGQVLTCLFLTVGGAFCISERDGWPRQAAGSGWLKPGAARSFWLAIALLLLSTLMWGVLLGQAGGSTHKAFRGLCAACAYPVLYLSLGVLVGRLTPLRRLGEPVATRVGFLLSVALGVFGSMALAVLSLGSSTHRTMNLFNPIVGLVNFGERSGSELDPALVLLGAVALLAAFLAAVVLHGRDEVRST